MSKIQIYTKSKNIKFTERQWNTLLILKRYDVDICRFIRDAVAEKIKRDWPEIKAYKDSQKVPF